MSLTPFQEAWVVAAREFELHVQAPFRLLVSDGLLEVPVLLEDFGAQRGMLLFEDDVIAVLHGDELVALGFGYSCIPSRPENFAAEALADMLSDWAWVGPKQPPERVAVLLKMENRTGES